MQSKPCTRCRVDKPLTEFYSWIDKKVDERRYQAWCKRCMKDHQQAKAHGVIVPKPEDKFDKDTPWELKRPSNRDKVWKDGYKSGWCLDSNCQRCSGAPCTHQCHQDRESSLSETL